jgi:hypothetical protein
MVNLFDGQIFFLGLLLMHGKKISNEMERKIDID